MLSTWKAIFVASLTFTAFYNEALVRAQPQKCGRSSVSLPTGKNSFPARTADFPWLVRLDIVGNLLCTATIINSEWLITAAKCMLTNQSKPVQPGLITAHMGDINLSINDVGEQQVGVDRVVIHPLHEEISSSYNFALLHLKKKLVYTDTVKPICLIDECIDENGPNSMCTLAGWGSDRELFQAGPTFDHLRKSNVPIADRTTCQVTLGEKPDSGDVLITDDVTCAGYPEGQMDDCQGDAGGPLVCRSMADNTYYLHGINSFGYGCELPDGYYHIYARPCLVMPWIRGIAGMNEPEAFEPEALVPALPIAKKVTRLILTGDLDEDQQQCGQNKYDMVAAGYIQVPRPALILEYPWQVRLEIGQFDSIQPYTCGATLISSYWVITSARCITGAAKENLTNIVAHFGEYDLRKPTGNEMGVLVSEAPYIHPNYDESKYDFDFALLRLDERVKFSDATRPICLLADCDSKPEDDKPTDCVTTGWRTIANRKTDPAKSPMQVAGVVIASEETCNASLSAVEYTERKLCVTSNDNSGRPACHVDAGGPLICKMASFKAYFLHGVASYSQRGCTRKDSFNVYARPCYVGRWIEQTIRDYAPPFLTKK